MAGEKHTIESVAAKIARALLKVPSREKKARRGGVAKLGHKKPES